MTLFRRFRLDVSAATSVLFAVMLVPLATAGGMAVDLSRVMTERTRVQGALDAAALIASHALQQHTTDEYRQIAESAITANLGKSSAVVTSVAVQQTDKEVIFDVSAKVPLAFAAIVGQSNFSLNLHSAINKVTPKKFDFHLLLDNSASMGLAVTPEGRDKLIQLRGCAFACHDPEGGQPTSNLYVAKQNGIYTRVDEMRDDVKDVLRIIKQKVDDSATDPVSITARVSIDSFDDNPAQQVALTDNIQRAIDYIDQFQLGYNTNFDNAMPLFRSRVTAQKETGTKTFALIVTDGVQGRRSRVGGFHPFDSNLCGPLKSKSTVIVLNTKYVPMPTQQPYRETVMPIQDLLAPALQACATSGWYFEAQDANDIHAQFERIIQRVFSELALTK